MIVTVTLNPAIDQTLVLDRFVAGDTLRVRSSRFDPGGKGINVSRVVKELGGAQGLFSAEGQDWHHQRRMVMAAFSPTHVRAYFPALMKVAQRLNGRWQRAAQQGQAIDLQGDLMRFKIGRASCRERV